MNVIQARSPRATLVRTLLPQIGIRGDALLVLGFSLFIALCARVALPLPFTPVPLTGQTFGVLVAGVLLGPRLGALSLLAYLGEGIIGLPVFSLGGSGLHDLLGPTGGYLISFPLAAFAVGLLTRYGWGRSFTTTALAMLLGNAIIYAIAAPWLAHWVGANHAFALGVQPFIPGDLLKALLAALLVPAGWRILARSNIRTQQ